MIVFVRVDDRVIHGQTLVRWLADYPCDGILIVDEALSKNQILAQVYKSAVPSNIKVHVFSIETALNKLPEAEASQKRYIVIFKSVITVSTLIDKGCQLIKIVNVGPCSKRPGTVEIVPTISLDQNEIAAYKKVDAAGVKVYFQIVPSAKKVWWTDIVSSLEK